MFIAISTHILNCYLLCSETVGPQLCKAQRAPAKICRKTLVDKVIKVEHLEIQFRLKSLKNTFDLICR